MSRWVYMVAGAAALSIASTQVHAQTKSGASGSIELEEIVVTAEKREADVQKTSISITTVSGDEIAAQAKNTVDAVLRDVPGVQVQGLAQGAQIFIRGVGSSIDPSVADPAVAMMVDGAYIGRTESVVAGGYDISRIEVLRGPQGTLYGRNASGGSVNVITNNPDLKGFSGIARGQVGNYGLYRAEAALNIPLGDVLALRVAGFKVRHSGYISDGSMDQDAHGGRAKLLFKPNDAFSMVLKAELYLEAGHGINSVAVPGSDGNLTFPPFMPAFAPHGWITNSSSPWSQDVFHPPGSINRRSEILSLQADADLGFATLTVLPSYSKHSDSLYSNYLFGIIPPGGGYSLQTPSATYKSIETRLASANTSAVKWLLGAYYLDSKGGPSGNTTVTAADSSVFNVNQDYKPGSTIAVFGQGTLPFTDTFRGVLGLRWSRDKQAEDFSIANSTINYDSGVSSYSNSQSSTTYKVGVEYDVARESMLYAHVSSGFKQGGISPAIPVVTFKPEKLTSYEVGSKNRFLNDTLQFNGAVFYYDYKDYQLSVFNSQSLGNTTTLYNATLVRNADRGTIFGGELELDWLFTANDEVRASLTHLDAKYGNIELPSNPFVAGGPYQLKGRQMANAPDWTGSLSYQHSWDIGPGKLIAQADARWSTAYYATPEFYLSGAYQKSYHTTNASLRYAAAEDRWSVGAWTKNIENDAQTTYVYPAYRRFVSAPFTFGLNGEVRF